MQSQKLFKHEFMGYKVTTSYLTMIMVLIIVPLSIFASIWNLSAGNTSKHILSNYSKNRNLPGISINQITGYEGNFRKVSLQGKFDPSHEFILKKNLQPIDLGSEVITPFFMDNDQQVVLVNQGWQQNRALGIKSDTPEGLVTISGYLYKPEEINLIDSSTEIETKPEILAKNLNKKIPKAIILLSSHEPYGFKRKWSSTIRSPKIYYDYAIKYFLFATILIVLFGILNIKKANNDDT
jgi:surfeit locus 1 family protein